VNLTIVDNLILGKKANINGVGNIKEKYLTVLKTETTCAES